MPRGPEATVAAIITRRKGRDEQVLLTRRRHPPFEGLWCLPGGHIDRYETARHAVVREVEEETGLDFEPDVLGSFDEIIPEYGWHAVVLVYVGEGHGEVSPQPEEVLETQWLAVDNVLALPLAFKHNEIIRAYAGATPPRY
jgi:8-oxo-dGTP diphosphatase